MPSKARPEILKMYIFHKMLVRATAYILHVTVYLSFRCGIEENIIALPMSYLDKHYLE